ncbi:hypothetical protein D9M70_563470 [compost metagenome]
MPAVDELVVRMGRKAFEFAVCPAVGACVGRDAQAVEHGSHQSRGLGAGAQHEAAALGAVVVLVLGDPVGRVADHGGGRQGREKGRIVVREDQQRPVGRIGQRGAHHAVLVDQQRARAVVRRADGVQAVRVAPAGAVGAVVVREGLRARAQQDRVEADRRRAHLAAGRV